jgi:hypothetical protein
MRTQTQNHVVSLLRQLRENRQATGADRRNLLRVMRNADMQDELLRRLREKYGVNVDNLRDLLKLFVEYAPQILKIVADVIAMFS